MNLIEDRWIPVRIAGTNEVKKIAPWEIVDTDIIGPVWGRADFDMACHEFLIGLLFLACPPVDDADRLVKKNMTAEELKAALEPYAAAFNLIGKGPLFMQEVALGEAIDEKNTRPLEALLLDGASRNSIRQNNDLMRHRNHLGRASLPFAAMLLYTFQVYAPGSGAGNRISLRGGGPMTVLLQAESQRLWDTLWLNVPYGRPSDMAILPWMQEKPMTSEEGNFHHCPDESGFTAEVFFGMPRRIFLITEDDEAVNFVQRPYGINYGRWFHPLSPYFRETAKSDWLAVHPRPWGFSCRDFFGIILDEPDARKRGCRSLLSLNMREFWQGKRGSEERYVYAVAAGWAMGKAYPLNYVRGISKLPHMNIEERKWLSDIIEATKIVSSVLYSSLSNTVGGGSLRDGVIDDFFMQIKYQFQEIQECYFDKQSCENWLHSLRGMVFSYFDQLNLGGLSERSIPYIKRVAESRKIMWLILHGHGRTGRKIYDLLGLNQ